MVRPFRTSRNHSAPSKSSSVGEQRSTAPKRNSTLVPNRSDARTIRHGLGLLSAKGSVRKAGDEFEVEAEMEGASARELNRTFLSALRKVEKRTTLRAEWVSADGTSERFFDYALKKTIKN